MLSPTDALQAAIAKPFKYKIFIELLTLLISPHPEAITGDLAKHVNAL
jgi:hypothetical protein